MIDSIRSHFLQPLTNIMAVRKTESKSDGEVKGRAVTSQRELAGGIKCLYYELMRVEDNGFRVMHRFIRQQHHLY